MYLPARLSRIKIAFRETVAGKTAVIHRVCRPDQTPIIGSGTDGNSISHSLPWSARETCLAAAKCQSRMHILQLLQ
jgi:hypothetical protein